jgi:hypothetical protein
MADSPMTDAHKRALIVAYYLSRFDRKGVRALGYQSFNDAFEGIAEKIGVKASTVKHMRDSFDPYCSQVRVGWYQRKVLPSRANVIQAYDEMSEAAMGEIVRDLLTDNAEAVALYTAPISNIDEVQKVFLSEENPFATRLRTGEKAETYFMEQYSQLTRFAGSTLDDTRKLGIGFDFRAVFPQRYEAIEVKGINEATGYISFTDKEWSVARLLEDSYVLALVRSLQTIPVLNLISNPAIHLTAQMRTVESVSVCWNAKV